MKNEVYSIIAEDIEIWAKIGMHKEESLVENCFNINVRVQAEKAYHKHHLINYELIINKVKLVFSRPQRVMEDICVEIIDEIKKDSPEQVTAIECEIKKLKLAINGTKVGALGVKMLKEF